MVQPSAVTADTEDTGGTMVELSVKILFSDVLHQDCQYPQRGSLGKQEVQRGLQGSRSARDGAMGVSSLLRRGWTSLQSLQDETMGNIKAGFVSIETLNSGQLFFSS